MIERFAAASMSLFGYGSLDGMKPFLQREGIHKALIVTDASIHKLGLLNPVTKVLEDAQISYVIYDEVMPNPTLENVNNGVQCMKENSCDAIIAVGGGSANDCAKAIRVLEANGGKMQDYVGGNRSRVKGKYLVAINTTAGTASEVSRAYLISNEQEKVKMIFKDDYAMPDLAVNDIQLMMKLPGKLTAQTGMDALTHAMEAYISSTRFALTNILALDAIRLITDNLEKAVNEPDNQDARANMSLGQYLAGLSFGSSGLGLVHAMAHQMGAMYHLPHGLCNAVLLPYVLEYDYPWCKQQFAEIAELLDRVWCEGKTLDEKAQYTLQYVKDLSARVGTNVALKDLGIPREDIPVLAERSFADGCINTSPKMPEMQDVIHIFEQAWEH